MNNDRLNLSFGPLTRENFDILSLSYFDSTFMYSREIQARERGITREDCLRVRLSEMATQGAMKPSNNNVVSDPTT